MESSSLLDVGPVRERVVYAATNNNKTNNVNVQKSLEMPILSFSTLRNSTKPPPNQTNNAAPSPTFTFPIYTPNPVFYHTLSLPLFLAL